MLDQLQKWFRSDRKPQGLQAVPRPLGIELLESRTVFSAAPVPAMVLIPDQFTAESVEIVIDRAGGEVVVHVPHSAAEGDEFDLRSDEEASVLLAVLRSLGNAEELRVDVQESEMKKPSQEPHSIGEGEAPSAEGEVGKPPPHLEPQAPSSAGSVQSPPVGAPDSPTPGNPPVVSPAGSQPAPSPSLLALGNELIAATSQANSVSNSALSSTGNSLAKEGLSVQGSYQPNSPHTTGTSRDAFAPAKLTRYATDSSSLSKEGGFIELDSMWKAKDAKRGDDNSSPALSAFRPTSDSRRSASNGLLDADLMRSLAPPARVESPVERQKEMPGIVKLPNEIEELEVARAQNQGGQIELSSAALAIGNGPSQQSQIAMGMAPLFSDRAGGSRRDRETELDVGVALYQAVELAVAPGENPAVDSVTADEAAPQDSTTMLDALTAFLNVENLVEAIGLPAAD